MTSTSAGGGDVATKMTPGGGGATTQAAKSSSDPPIRVDTLLPSAFMTTLLTWTAERRLTPVTVDPIPAAAVVVAPVSRHPHDVRPRWNHVVTLYPDVGVAIPAVKAGNPHVARSRRYRN